MVESDAEFGRLLREETTELVRFLEDTSLTELVFEDGDLRIHIVRSLDDEILIASTALMLPDADTGDLPDPYRHTVTAPVVGRFLLGAGNASPLHPGARIEMDDQVGVIESMRVP